MRINFLFILFFFSIAFNVFGQQTITGTIMHDGIQRDYRLYIPAGYSIGTPVPLVFNLHGYTSNAFEQQLYSEMDAVAEAHTFLVCYPNGVGEAWNVEWNFGSTADDVGFIRNLIDELAAVYSINLARVYSCGMSNGGFMSYRLACELNDKIAAIASVTGSLTPGYVCEPDKAVPVMEIHGTADPVVPYNGQAQLCTNIDDVVGFWATNNNCESNPDTTEFENINLLDLSTASRIDFDACENSKVSLIKIQGGGHTWPGASIIVGTTNQDVNASEEIWAFFNQFELGGLVNDVSGSGFGKKAVALFPNPASDEINIDFGTSLLNGDYFISNAISQTILSGKISGPIKNIQIGKLKSGLYVLTIIHNDHASSHTFIKK